MGKILYAEDNEDTAEAVKIMLSSAGLETEIASCGKDCIQSAQREQYDLFLLDIMLPDMSGWDVFQKLRKLKIEAKFVFLSAIPISTERMQELRKAGVSDYITKPFKKNDLIARVQKALG